MESAKKIEVVMTEEAEKYLSGGTLVLDCVEGKLAIISVSRNIKEIHNAIDNAHKLFKPVISSEEWESIVKENRS